MQNSISVNLDAEELTHLGAALAAQGRLEEALLYFKTAVQQEPDNAQAHYVLGTHYAQLGMAQRAADCMGRAVDLNPELTMASFQCGWLLMGLSKKAEAHSAWQPLLGLEVGHPLHLFARGMQALLDDEFETCKTYLEQGIAANQRVEALNNDMRKILTELQQRGLVAKEPAHTSAYAAYSTKVN